MLARLRKMQEEREEGFTLIELLVVIIIIGILAAIAIPVFLSQRQKGYDAGVKSDIRNAATAEESYLTDNDNYYAGQISPNDGILSGSSGEGMKFSNAKDYDSTKYYLRSEFVDSSGASATVDNVAYCIEGKSSSGHTFAYNSALGGMQSTNAVCPGMTL
ncbi:MAG: prepilin-type N-terminal cleavage/methylation domain-containing protein [Mycobacteriales bacterium]